MAETVPIVTPASKLYELKRAQFPADTRAQRIATAVTAVNAPSALQLTAEQWKHAAESPELEEED